MGKISTIMIATVLSVAAAAPAMSQMTEKQKKHEAFWSRKMEQKNREYGQRRDAEDAARATPVQQKKENTRVFYNGANYFLGDPGYSDAQKAATARFNELRKKILRQMGIYTLWATTVKLAV